jgi:2-keto-4-pentenoate hydratase/2-oxohepta-3-ene-1,7-dioic acid hydratase in catechol pathway
MSFKTSNYDDTAHLRARLANLRTPDGYALGVEMVGGVLNVTATAAALGLPAPQDMDDLLQNGLGVQVCEVLNATAQQRGSARFIDAASIEFAPLVTRPEKIMCIGFNYQKHAEETEIPILKAPPLFSNYHNGTIKLPTHIDNRFDYETELVILFGREFRDVSEADALNYVAGYATGNDFSTRTMQTATTQFLAGKTSDGFGPVGVTRDRLPDPNNLRIQTYVNGQKRQDGNTNDMIFNCRQLISFVSSLMTIKPGDLLFTCTPQGVIFGEKASIEQRRWLKAGDEVISTLEGLGNLRVQLI